MQSFYEELDNFFANGQIQKVEPFLRNIIDTAKKQENVSLEIAAQNELVGFLRSIGRYEEATTEGLKTLDMLKGLGLSESVHSGTTMVNTATAMRGTGRYEESLKMYEQALNIYKSNIHATDYRIAGLYNNMSIVYENIENYSMAKKYLLMSIDIIKEHRDLYIQHAIGMANLAQLNYVMKLYEEGKASALSAIQIFVENNATTDSHYSGALAAMALGCYYEGDYAEAKKYYGEAMDNVKKFYGETEYYHILKTNYEDICKILEGVEKCWE